MLSKLALSSRQICARSSARAMSTSSGLREILEAQIPAKRERIARLTKEHGDVKVGTDVTIAQLIGGMRGIRSMLWETSNLDAEEGIRFRGHTIPDLQQALPTVVPGGEPTPEGLFWLLLTGEIPTQEQHDALTQELHARAPLPEHVKTMIRNFPRDMHPMTQFSSAVMACQTDSQFAAGYARGMHKTDYWQPVLEDSLNLIARLPEIAATIYRCSFHDGHVAAYDSSLDYSANFARMLGYHSEAVDELMRLYLVIHSDHEGGNASAHTTHLVGSTLSDPYLSFAAGLNALAGPLHGLANQEVLRWIMDLQAEFKSKGKEVNADTITEFAWDTLNAGKVIPGYGHAVLRKTDPRYTCQREFALKHLPNDELFHIVSTVYEVMPGVLTEHGKTANPWPNVDSHSGVLLQHYGFTEENYYTVLFGVSRALGCVAQLFWDRALGLPLERPKSLTPEFLESLVESQ